MRKDTRFVSSIFLASALLCVAAITAAFGQPGQPVSVANAPAHPTPMAGDLVSALPNPQRIVSANVVDMNGKIIGRVEDVKTDADGRPSTVDIALVMGFARGRSFTVRADELGYNAQKGVVVANISPSQLAQMSASGQSGGGGPGTFPRSPHPSSY